MQHQLPDRASAGKANQPTKLHRDGTRLTKPRCESQAGGQIGSSSCRYFELGIWGNHSPTMYPDFTNAKIAGRVTTDVISDHDWLNGPFIKTVQQRGRAIIDARGKSSRISCEQAAIHHARDWFKPTAPGEWVSMAVTSDGSYGVPEGLIFSFPCTVDGTGRYEIVQGISLDDTAMSRVNKSADELVSERDDRCDLLK